MTSGANVRDDATLLSRFTLTLTLSLKGEEIRSKTRDEKLALEEDFLR
jgi:hypothetical protein